MSSTTEDSDWNMHPQSNEPGHLSAPIPRAVLAPKPPPVSSSAPFTNPPAERFAAVPVQLRDQLIPPVLSRNMPAVSSSLAASAASTLAAAEGLPQAASIQSTPQWQAAKNSVLNQMVTSEDLNAAVMTTPTPTIAKKGAKTGGRRGRGGRGPRTKIKAEPTDDEVLEQIAASTVPVEDLAATAAKIKLETPPTRGKNRGGRPRGSRSGTSSARGGRGRGGTPGNRGGRPRGGRAGATPSSLLRQAVKKRRKRNNDDDSDGINDSDVSEEFNLLAHTSSGRRITQAKTFSPVVLDPPTSSSRKAPLSNRTVTTIVDLETPTATTKRPRATKRRKVGETAVCINCGRGHSPNSNQIVFCDGCNTPWHQYCHNRPITPSVILIEEKEWLCSDCSTVRDDKNHINGKVASQYGTTTAEKRTYFHGLDKSELVSLILHASNLHPDLPIFLPPQLAQPVPMIVEPRPLPAPIQSGMDEEEYVEMYVEGEPLPYPTAGNGIVLPPENDDMAFLIDEDVISYSHSWKGYQGGWEGPGGMSWSGGFTANSMAPIGVGA